MIRAFVAETHGVVRAGVRLLLETAPDIEVVGDAADGHEAVRLVLEVHPDVVLMEIRMPRVNGIEATRRILASAPHTNVLMFTALADEAYVYGALTAGAVGFLLKDGEPADMIDAVRRAVRGSPLLSPVVLAQVLERARRSYDADRISADQVDTEPLSRLTPRERDVLTLVGAGLSNADIAARLHLGVTTVKTHIVAVLDKLGARNRVRAGVLAHRLGLVNGDFRPVDPVPR